MVACSPFLVSFNFTLAAVVFVSMILPQAEAGGLDRTASCVSATERQACGDFSCNRTSHFCTRCVIDEDCTERALYCDAPTGKCKLKSLKDGGDGLTVLAPLIAIFVCTTGVVAGLGGGGILVPGYWLVLGVPVTTAVGLSQITIVGQAVFNVALQVQRRHPDHDGSSGSSSWPLVNYEMMLLILPFALVGTLLGKMAGDVSPDWFRVAMLVLLLGALMVRLIFLMIHQRRRDARARSAVRSAAAHHHPPHQSNNEPVAASAGGGTTTAQEGEHEGDEMMSGELEGNEEVAPPIVTPADVFYGPVLSPGDASGELVDKADDGLNLPAEPVVDVSIATSTMPEAATGEEEEEVDLAKMELGSKHPNNSRPQYPVIFILVAVLVFCMQLMFSILRSKSAGVAKCGSGAYVGIIVAAVVWNTLVALAVRAYLVHLRSRHAKGELPPSVTPFEWNPLTTIVFPVFSLVAGGAASWFGIGGGMILNSLFLEAKIVPAAVSATGGLATMMTALQSAAIFIVDGQLPWDYGLVVLAGGFVGTAIGQLIIMERIRKAGAQYLIIVALLIVLVGSMVTQIAMGVYQTVIISDEGGTLGFNKLCK